MTVADASTAIEKLVSDFKASAAAASAEEVSAAVVKGCDQLPASVLHQAL